MVLPVLANRYGRKTAGTLTFVVYLLAEHPDVMVRLRDEILSKVGPSMRPSYDDLRDMKYLRAVINGESCHLSSFWDNDPNFAYQKP